MQKFKEKIKNLPTNTSLVRCSKTCQLNKEETLSVDKKALSLNNPEENQSCLVDKKKHYILVFVFNKEGQPLMPCSPAKAKRLLKAGKAKVVKRIPFTIKLLHGSSGYRQSIILGIDTGYKNVGFSAVSEKKELISGMVELRTDIPDKLKERLMYRKSRRNKLWYRKPRWENRKRIDMWLSPSVKHKVESHIKIIEKIKKLLPISTLIIETGLFDTHKMKEGFKDYQKGEKYGFENTKAYVLSRDNYKCYFNNKCTEKLHVHHIKFRSTGGTDNPLNLITLCEKHHKQVHDGKLKLDIKKHKELKSATMMNIIKKRLMEYFSNAIETFGYITKARRLELNIGKSHSNDAFVITSGDSQIRCKEFYILQKRRNNRAIQLNRKGFKPSIRKQRYKIQPKDFVRVNGKEYLVKGIHSYGIQIKLIDRLNNIVNIATKKLDRYHFYQNNLIWGYKIYPQS